MLRLGRVALALAAVVVASGCGAEEPPVAHDPQPSGSSGVVHATPRGLAASVLAHLDGADVVSISGSGDNNGLVAHIGLAGADITGVFVSVSGPEIGPGGCGTDSGFGRIDCTEGPPFMEVVEKKTPGPRTPIYLGRARTDDRGSVLVEIFGEHSAESLALVRELVADPLIGLETTADLNEQGEAIDDFGETHVEVRISTR